MITKKTYINKTKISDRASQATKTLEKAWRMLMEINRNKVKIPLLVILVLSGGDRTKKKGHHSHPVWNYRGDEKRPEVGITSDLFHSPQDIIEVMLHEAGHAVLKDHNWGVGSDYNYHTKYFRNACQVLGLQCSFNGTYHGWNLTYWENGLLPNQYEPVRVFLKANLPKGTKIPERLSESSPKEQDLPKSGHIRLECQCKNSKGNYGKNTIFVTKSMLERVLKPANGVRCETCGALFRVIKNVK